MTRRYIRPIPSLSPESQNPVLNPELPQKTKQKYASYSDYLKSDVWKNLKYQALKRDDNRCRCCNSKKQLQVHHRCYSNIWGEESVRNLTTLCGRCHRLFSLNNHKREKPQKKKQFIKNLPNHYVDFKFDNDISGYASLPD